MKYSILIIIVFMVGCKEEFRKSHKDKSDLDKTGLCFTKTEKIKIIDKILNVDNIHAYLHLEMEDRNPIRLVRNNFFLGLDSFRLKTGHSVKIVDTLPKSEFNMELKLFSSDSCKFSKSKFMFFSPIENAEVNGNVIFSNLDWNVQVVNDIEF